MSNHSRFRRALQSIFGEFQWSRPAWLSITRSRYPHLGQILLGLIILAIVLQYWYYHRPQTQGITAEFAPLIIPAPSDQLQSPPALTLQFGLKARQQFNPQSVMPLAQKREEFFSSDKIKISPAMQGQWQWLNDHTLTFQPKTDWQAAQAYTFHFAPDFFAKQAQFNTYQFTYTAPPLNPRITEFKLYHDPNAPEQQLLIATLQFNYPVDSNSLLEHVTIAPQTSNTITATKLAFTVTYAKQGRIAYLRTSPINLSVNPSYYLLTINKAIHAKNSTQPLNDNVVATVLVPDAGSMMKITGLTAEILRNPQSEPEQIIKINTSLGVKTATLQATVHAYQLPKDYPATKLFAAKENYTWKDPGEVTADILQTAQSIPLTAIPAPHDHATLHAFSYHATPSRYLYVVVDNLLQGDGNYQLKNTYQTILAIPKYPQETRFIHHGALLALGSEHKLTLQVRGLATVKYAIARVLPKEINHLITQTAGNFSDPYFLSSTFSKDDLSEVFSRYQDFNDTDPSKAQYTALDLDKFLAPSANNPKPLGLFLLKVQGFDRSNNYEIDGTSSSRLILLTDMALIVKKNLDNSRDVFVSSITQGKPVAGSKVTILGRNGLPLATQTTDAQGHVSFAELDPEKYKDDQEPVVFVATHNNDVSFIPFARTDREINFSRFDIGGIEETATEDNLTAFIFSDRGIYRPGETAHLGLIVKKAYAEQAEAGLPLEMVITDPQGNTVKDDFLTTPTNGYFTQDFITQDTSVTGTYNVTLYIVKDKQRGNFLGETQILVQDFLPDTMKISAEFSPSPQGGWLSPENLFANVKLANLYGTPSAMHRITGKIILNPRHFAFKQYKDYRFNDPLYNKDKPPHVISETLPETTTDAKGQAQFALNLARFAKATYELRFYTQGFAKDSGRSVNQEISTLVSPLRYLLGYKVDGDYSFLAKNAKNSVSLLVISPQLKPITRDKLQAAVIKQTNVVSLVEKENGTYDYQTIVKEETLKTEPLTIPASGMTYALPTVQIGQYVLAILAEDGMTLARIPFNVVGDNAKIVQKNTELTLSLAKKEYAPGDNIQVQISAPYTGNGLITIERDQTYAYQWFSATTPNSVQSITLPKDFVGNGYVNVTYIRDWNSPEIFLNPLSYSVAPFNVDRSKHKVDVKLTVPETAHAGKALTIAYQSHPAAQLIVYAVDEGILRASDYATPKPLEYFFQKRALTVNTQQIVDEILPKYIANREISSVAGDGTGRKAMEAYLNPFKRKGTPPVAFWSGLLNADDTVKTVEFQLPESFNGTLRTMAVAAADNAVGSSEQATLVQNDFILIPNVPTFAAPGDRFTVAVNVTNNLKTKAAINVSLTVSDNLQLLDTKPQIVELNPGTDSTLHFAVRAKDILGNADIKFTAEDAAMNKRSTETANLSIRPAMPFSTVIQSGFNQSGTVTLNLDPNLYAEQRVQRLAAGNNPLIFVTGLSQYLALYPYGCTEQITSRAFASLLLHDVIKLNDPTQSAEDNFKSLMGILLRRQMSDGSFNYWPGLSDDQNLSLEQRFSSVYAMHLLTEAQEAKEDVPKEAFSRGIDSLRQLAEMNTTNLDMARIQAYAIYVLTRNDIVTSNYLTNLEFYLDKNYAKTWHQDIISSYLAATYALLRDQKTAENLITGYHLGANAPQDNVFYNQASCDAQYLFLLAKHFPNRLQQLGERAMLDLANNISNDVSTTTAAFDLLALTGYSQVLPKTSNQAVTVQATNGQQHSTTLTQPLAALSLDNTVQKLILSASQGFFYQLSQHGFTKTLPTKQVSAGIEITHEYADVQNHPVQEVKLGDEVTVHIKLRSLTSQSHPHMAIVDLLPGGFDIVPKSANGSYLFQEAREDRMLFFGFLPENQIIELSYRIKAVAPGEYAVPPAFAEDMYNARVRALSVGGKLVVK